tara:strand:- start:128 stop:322 length:195 start_codon:yes stop_codon:yes gene_type:complete
MGELADFFNGTMTFLSAERNQERSVNLQEVVLVMAGSSLLLKGYSSQNVRDRASEVVSAVFYQG